MTISVVQSRHFSVPHDAHDSLGVDSLKCDDLSLEAIRLAHVADDLAGHHDAFACDLPALAAATWGSHGCSVGIRQRAFDIGAGDRHENELAEQLGKIEQHYAG